MHNMQQQSRFVRQPSYSADKSKSRFVPRSRLRLYLRRLCCVDNTLPAHTASHLRSSSRSPFFLSLGLIFSVLFVLVFVIRPFQRSERPSSFAVVGAHHSGHSFDSTVYNKTAFSHALDDNVTNIVDANPNDPNVNGKLHPNNKSEAETEADTDDDQNAKNGTDTTTTDEDKDGDKDADADADADGDGDGAANDDDDKDANNNDSKDDTAPGNDTDDDDTTENTKSNTEPDKNVDADNNETAKIPGEEPISAGTRHDHSQDKPLHVVLKEQEGMKLAVQPDVVRDKYANTKMSAVVLFHNEYDSLNTALGSWVKYKLIDYVDEIVFFLNGVQSSAEFRRQIPLYEKGVPIEKRRIILSKTNLPIGLAITRMVELSRFPTVLLLEKDWELIENEAVMRSRLTDSKVLIGTGVAHVVRHRHRHDPGVPLHALIMHQGREESIFRQQPNLLCFCHHWVHDPAANYPGKGYMWRCGGSERHAEEEDVFCATSKYCNWVNNPAVFEKKWFMEEVGDRYRKEYDIEKGKYGPSSPFLDFEYYTNWRSYAWTDKNFTVAVGTGLFRHSESEHRHFNTFWYAHYRLTVDLEEIRNFYLKNETAFKKLGGVHYDPNYPRPLPMRQRYPVDFVRKFQWEPTFTGTLEQQIQAVDRVYKDYLDTYRVTAAEWNGQGTPPAKATKNVPWRAVITDIHNAVEKAMMLVPPIQPWEMSITLVTSLLDIGRHGLAEDAYQFRRDFKMYLDAMQDWLQHRYPKVVYTSERIRDELLRTASDQVKATTKFVITTNDELRTKWLGPDNYAKVQELRVSSEWRARAGWLPNSPQAGLEYYNPLVMSKMFMVRDAARENFWKTTHFLFVDAKHNCRKPDIMTPKNDHIIRAHMFEKFLLTTFDYTPADEVHGFAYEQFNGMCNMENPKKRQNVRVGRGGIFGGNAFVMEYMTAAYDVALTATLRENLMGTEENIMSIIMYNLRQYVDEFSNNWACPDNVEKDHMCKNLQHQGYNCAIFDWVARDAVPWPQN